MRKIPNTLLGHACFLALALSAGLAFISCDDSTSAAESSKGKSAEIDTVYVRDTVFVNDSIATIDTVNVRDTITSCDTITTRDTLNNTDTVSIINTVTITVHDTINTQDTVSIRDTVKTTVHDTLTVTTSSADSCTVTNNDDGSMSVTCNGNTTNLYPALCGGLTYDANSQDCVDDSIVDMCGGKAYDPDNQICEGNIVYDVMRDTRDQKLYKIVTIGNQTWMAQNLNYNQSNSACGGGSSSKTKSGCDIHGRIYAWSAAMGLASKYDSLMVNAQEPYQGICPEGWHIPSSAEWTTLRDTIMAMHPTIDFDVQMRADSLWDYSSCMISPCTFAQTGENTVGMNVLPTGRYFYSTSDNAYVYRDTTVSTTFATIDEQRKSTADSSTHVNYMSFYNEILNSYTYQMPIVSSGAAKFLIQFAVRCVKD